MHRVCVLPNTACNNTARAFLITRSELSVHLLYALRSTAVTVDKVEIYAHYGWPAQNCL